MFDFAKYLRTQRIWSLGVFGGGRRTKGVIAHIKKELQEIEEAPLDLSEWIDVVILALDGAHRAGYSPEQIIEQLERKQNINMQREWPEPGSEDEVVEHIREGRDE